MDFIEDGVADGQSPRQEGVMRRVWPRFLQCVVVQSAKDRVDQRVTGFAYNLDRQNLFWPG